MDGGAEVSRRAFVRGGTLASTAVLMGAGGILLTACDPGPLLGPDGLGLRLPPLFTGRLLATTGQTVPGTNHVWHQAPDGGACFALPDGGWSYVSNAEAFPEGGAGFLRFDAGANLIDAGVVLDGSRTTVNCSGGAMPWGTWLSCEELPTGRVFECDPLGAWPAVERPALGRFWHEAAVADPINEVVYLTEDPFVIGAPADGGVYRFTPDSWGDLSSGLLEIMTDVGAGPVWQPVPDAAATTTPTRYQVPDTIAFNKAEGCDMVGEKLLFTEKSAQRVWAYDPTAGTLEVIYDGLAAPGGVLAGPDALRTTTDGVAYVAEDGGDMQVVLVREDGAAFPVVQLVGVAGSEITGVAFDPSGTRLYFSSQRNPGQTFEITGPWSAFTEPGPPPLAPPQPPV
ncbi:MAG: alkaline phosphatase PhoX [Acidimicrobiales bacterium]